MRDITFSYVDAGCLMHENRDGRWIIEHPTDGYFPTSSRLWDVLIEHHEHPHTLPLKYMGSFKTKLDAMHFVKRQLKKSINYFKAQGISNKFYYQDYTTK